MKSWIIPPTGGIRTEIYRKESNGNSRTKNNAVLKLRIQCNSRLGFPGGSVVKNTPANAGDARETTPSLGREDPLEKELATRCSILAWRIPRTEEPGRSTVHRVAKSRTRVSRLSTHIPQLCGPCPPFPPHQQSARNSHRDFLNFPPEYGSRACTPDDNVQTAPIPQRLPVA